MPVVRKLASVCVLAAGVALSTAGIAAAAGGGFAPPPAHSPNVHHTNIAYWTVFGFTTFIFLLVETTLVVFIWRYRSRGRARTIEGNQLHGHTRLELIWTVIPVVILAIIASVVFLELPGIRTSAADASTSLTITVEGHMFYWQFDYPNGSRSINELHVPVNRDVDLRVVSADVVHNWWIPQLEGKIQAIPGRINHTWFKADKEGTYYGQCALICGVYHALMKATVVVEPEADYQAFISGGAAAGLGKAEWQGVCATCHGMQGQGGFGPALSSNSILAQQRALEAIVRNGRGQMPPVGNTWTEAQINALARYAKTHIYKGASTSGG
jgi:cytochrome c oxidase subunit II